MRKGTWTCLAFAIFMAVGTIVPVSFTASTSSAWAQGSVLDEVQRLYDAAQFGEAVTKLRDALSSGEVTGQQTLKAKEMLGRCLVKAGDRVEAKEAFKSLLRQDGGYRLDSVSTPPDEVEVFNLALKEITAEQIEAGRRVPASIGLFFGVGSGASSDFADLPRAGGSDSDFDSKPEFGGSVRFPIRPRFSLDIELARFRGTNADTFPVPNKFDYETTAIPLVVSIYWTVFPEERYRVNVFAGGGPMMASRGAIKFNAPGTGYFVADEKVGTYFHGGVEGEWLFSPRISVSGRVVGRLAKATGLFEDSQVELYASNAPLKDREVDFSGFGAFIGVRGYIGY